MQKKNYKKCKSKSFFMILNSYLHSYYGNVMLPFYHVTLDLGVILAESSQCIS